MGARLNKSSAAVGRREFGEVDLVAVAVHVPIHKFAVVLVVFKRIVLGVNLNTERKIGVLIPVYFTFRCGKLTVHRTGIIGSTFFESAPCCGRTVIFKEVYIQTERFGYGEHTGIREPEISVTRIVICDVERDLLSDYRVFTYDIAVIGSFCGVRFTGNGRR